MAEYRICLINAQNVVVQVQVTECGSDADALFAAKCMIGEQQAVEVWDRTRLVGKIDIPAPGAPKSGGRPTRATTAEAAISGHSTARNQPRR